MKSIKNGIPAEELKSAEDEYLRIKKEIADGCESMLIQHFGHLYSTWSAYEISILVLQKISLLAKFRFEKELEKVWDPNELDPVLLSRQNDLITVMLLAEEQYLNYTAKVNKIKENHL